MSSTWASALASLDECLAALERSLERIEAARPVDMAQVIGQLEAAAERSRKLCGLMSAEQPQATWQHRRELDALVAARDLQQQRSRLLVLATELEQGSIVHRRAVRANQLNQLREQASKELRAQAELERPPHPLPGPEAAEWVGWACGLKEPDDAESLLTLRNGFPYLDELVTNLEPGMWSGTSMPQAPLPEEPEPATEFEARIGGQRRSRLLTVATELERGRIVHHRTTRGQQLNKLREQAVEELRSQAGSPALPPALPGPEADHWVEWACGLKEPEDAESLQILRSWFPHLDEFVANIEFDMWRAAGSPGPQVLPEAPRPADKTPTEQLRPEAEELQQSPEPSATAEPAFTSAPAEPAFTSGSGELPFTAQIPHETSDTPAVPFRLMPEGQEFWAGKRRIWLPTAGLLVLLVLLVPIAWRSHRKHANDNVVKAAEANVPNPAAGNPVNQPYDQSGTLSAAGTSAAGPAAAAPAKAKDPAVAAKLSATAPTEKPASMLDDSGLRTPQAIPKQAALASGEEALPPGGTAAVPGGLSNGVPNGVNSVLREVPVATPKVAAQKVRVSSGVAQRLLIHQVTPKYPIQARSAGIQGTVVLQAVIGKDGRVQDVRALRGPPTLIPAAVDAVKQWRYKPFQLNGEAAEADIEINVNFTK